MGEEERVRALHVLTDDEIIRERVRKQMNASPPSPWWSTLLRHPLVQVLFGFALTWWVGTYLAGKWAEEDAAVRAREERTRVETEASLKAVQDFSRVIHERRARAALLLSALRRNRPMAEVRAKREAYEQAYIDWERHSQANLLTIRAATGAKVQSPFEQLILTELDPSFKRLDLALAAAYDRRLRGAPPGDWAPVYVALRSTTDCGFAVADQLFRVIADSTERASLGISLRPIESIKSECGERPGLPPPPPAGP